MIAETFRTAMLNTLRIGLYDTPYQANPPVQEWLTATRSGAGGVHLIISDTASPVEGDGISAPDDLNEQNSIVAVLAEDRPNAPQFLMLRHLPTGASVPGRYFPAEEMAELRKDGTGLAWPRSTGTHTASALSMARPCSTTSPTLRPTPRGRSTGISRPRNGRGSAQPEKGRVMTIDSSQRKAREVRIEAAELSTEKGYETHKPNGDDKPPYLFNFTKGLKHELNGLLVDPTDFETFVAGTEVHDPAEMQRSQPFRGAFVAEDVRSLPALDVYRRWESPTSGHAYVGEGPDPYAVTMPPAPEVGSAEFAAEMAEVYQMALGRDWATAALMDESLVSRLTTWDGLEAAPRLKKAINDDHAKVQAAATRMGEMRWFKGTEDDGQDDLIKARRRFESAQTPGTLFRGVGEDGWATPFLSQFMVMGSGGKNNDEVARNRASGMIQYGAQRIPQTVRVATPGKDYMTCWADWLNVQNGLNKRALVPPDIEFVKEAHRPMARLRDLATYVHDDALYQAYLNAALILLDEGFDLDPGIPYHAASLRKFPFDAAKPDDRNQTPFALFGPPHLLTLVTEVSSRALKAVRLQKFSIHRRMRPEAAAALFHTVFTGYHPHRDIAGTQPYAQGDGSTEAAAVDLLADKVAPYTHPYVDDKATGSEKDALVPILSAVLAHNINMCGENTWLLPMAFPEGSPMHPAYGAGHATVAGACVTLLKAFFAMTDPRDATKPVYLLGAGQTALVPDAGGKVADTKTGLLGVRIDRGLTLEGELNKLMWNISNGRNIAGVHYYTDYIESALLGEAITIGILREQMLAYHPNEKVEMTVPLLVPRTLPKALLSQGTIGEGETVAAVKIRSDGGLERAGPTMGRA